MLRSIEKINSAIRKRNGIADKFCKKDLKKTRLYIFAIRINKDLEDSIIQMVTANGIELRLCEDISHALEFYELPMKEGKQRPVTPCMDIPGNQPLDGIMKCSEMNEDLDGYPNVGHIQIEYMFPDGVQSVKLFRLNDIRFNFRMHIQTRVLLTLESMKFAIFRTTMKAV